MGREIISLQVSLLGSIRLQLIITSQAGQAGNQSQTDVITSCYHADNIFRLLISRRTGEPARHQPHLSRVFSLYLRPTAC